MGINVPDDLGNTQGLLQPVTLCCGDGLVMGEGHVAGFRGECGGMWQRCGGVSMAGRGGKHGPGLIVGHVAGGFPLEFRTCTAYINYDCMDFKKRFGHFVFLGDWLMK